MKASHGLTLGALLGALRTYALSLPTDAQAVLGLNSASTHFDADEYLFPSEINAREAHGEYQLWRIRLQYDEVDEEDLAMEYAGFEDTATYISRMTNLLNLDVWHSSPTHMDVLLPSHEIQRRFLDILPARHAANLEIVIRDFPALYESQAKEVAALSSQYDDLESDTLDEAGFAKVLRKGKGKGRKGRKGRKHRKPTPSPSPDPPPGPAPLPPPPPVGSNRTTPDIYNTTDINTAFHDAYHPLSVLYDFMDELETTYGSGDLGGAVKVFTLGMSAEGREIRGVKIHKPREGLRAQVEETGRKVRGKGRKAKTQGELEEEKVKEIYIQGGQHAREWVSPATVLYFTHHLLVSAFIDNNTHALDLLDRYEFTLVPTINPDGYVYSQEHSRLWRKNRQDLNYGSCRGIDMNSNWGYQWAPSLFSNPCSESYPGAEAFEAAETKAVADYLTGTPNNVRAFIDVHSYGQLFMFPYSYSCSDFPKDAETLMEAGLGVAKALKGIHGTTYQAGQACDLVYRMAGDATDWSYASAGIEWSYSAELRDTGTYGFLLPGSLIRPSAEEITAGLVYLAQFIARLESPS